MERQEKNSSLSLRGGSLNSNSSYKISDMVSPQSMKGSKSLPTFDHLISSSQSLDTHIKSPYMSSFMILWTFICSLCADLTHGIKDIFLLLWAAILLRLPFLKNSSKNKKGNSSPSSTSQTLRHSQMRKPITKQIKFNTNKVKGKTETKDGKSRK